MNADRSRTTLRSLVVGTVARNLAWAAAALASWSVATALAGPVAAGQLGYPSGDASGGTSGGPAAGSTMDRVAALVARHDCWSDAAPAGREPTRAVVTLPDGRPRLAPADTGYGIWIDGDAGVLHAFCP